MGLKSASLLSVGCDMGYGLSNLNKGRHAPKKTNFPMRVHGYDLAKENEHAVVGLNLVTNEKVRVVLVSRNSGDRKGAEIAHFATGVEATEEGSSDLRSKALTAVGGLLMIEDAYYDKPRDVTVAGWARSLSHTVNESAVEVSVLACVNPMHVNGETMRGSVDIVYPERGDVAIDLSHMHDLIRETLTRASKGVSLCMVSLRDIATGETGTKLLIPRVSAEFESYTPEDPDDAIERFWESLGDSEQADEIMRGINDGNIRARVIPGVRYWFLRKWLEDYAQTPDKHGSRYRLKDSDLEEGGHLHGFLVSTVTLRQHVNSDKCFPSHVIPQEPFARPAPLQAL